MLVKELKRPELKSLEIFEEWRRGTVGALSLFRSCYQTDLRSVGSCSAAYCSLHCSHHVSLQNIVKNP